MKKKLKLMKNKNIKIKEDDTLFFIIKNNKIIQRDKKSINLNNN